MTATAPNATANVGPDPRQLAKFAGLDPNGILQGVREDDRREILRIIAEDVAAFGNEMPSTRVFTDMTKIETANWRWHRIRSYEVRRGITVEMLIGGRNVEIGNPSFALADVEKCLHAARDAKRGLQQQLRDLDALDQFPEPATVPAAPRKRPRLTIDVKENDQ